MDSDVILIYRCFTCNEKKIFFPNDKLGTNADNDRSVLEYIEYDKVHKNCQGFILIEKISATSLKAKEEIIARIIEEIANYKV